ncbi:MAG: hypothetical protein GXP35_17940 [Actinobacteria bacterium]|nr:hypothetical protein [Actinomycetota bacterium]
MATTVQRLGVITNLVHGFIYFAPEAAEEYSAIGLTGRAQYFGSRAAPMGAVGPEMVVATFFNFWPGIVRDAIPAAWAMASPDAIQQARLRAAGRVLARACPDLDLADVEEATAIAASMVDGVGDEGKPLAAANRAVVLPDDRVVRLWQLVTTIREWRGDAHVAALCSAPVTAVEALVLHAATGQVTEAVLRSSRRWPDADWASGVDALQRRGLLEADGTFSDAGRLFRDDIEQRTDDASQPLVDAVGDASAQRLCDLLVPIRSGLLGAKVFPWLDAASDD